MYLDLFRQCTTDNPYEKLLVKPGCLLAVVRVLLEVVVDVLLGFLFLLVGEIIEALEVGLPFGGAKIVALLADVFQQLCFGVVVVGDNPMVVIELQNHLVVVVRGVGVAVYAVVFDDGLAALERSGDVFDMVPAVAVAGSEIKQPFVAAYFAGAVVGDSPSFNKEGVVFGGEGLLGRVVDAVVGNDADEREDDLVRRSLDGVGGNGGIDSLAGARVLLAARRQNREREQREKKDGGVFHDFCVDLKGEYYSAQWI